MASIYIHIPFCQHKCKYCSFVSFCNSERNIDEYIDCLCKEISSVKRIDIDTIYIGGGTPSILTCQQISKIFDCIKQYHYISSTAEISIECNPNSVTLEKMNTYKALGINRISIGVQSLNNQILSSIGRLHNKKQALQVLKVANLLFDNISVDLILGLPFQKTKYLLRDIKILSKYASHFSIYSLMLEKGTQLYKEVQDGKISLPSEDKSVIMYDKANDLLNALGFSRYEISNFSKGKPCRHNMVYWQGGDYYGFGVASHGFIQGWRYSNTESLQEYLSGITRVSSQQVNVDEAREEYIMLRLRTIEGIDLVEYKTRFGQALEDEKRDSIQQLIKYGAIVIKDNHLVLTDVGFHIVNYVVLSLV